VSVTAGRGSGTGGSPEERDDRELAAAAQAGDVGAFEALVERHRHRVFWLAQQVVGNAEDARDVAQEVLVRLWRTLGRYDQRYAFSTWVHRMTVNLAIDSLRRSARRRHDTELDEQLVAAPGPVAATASPERQAVAGEVRRIFDELKGLLPTQQRLVFTLREIEGLPSDEVAAILDLSPSTVRNHLFQARRTLQAELRSRYPEYAPPAAAGEKAP
jgi:RNA polymerase sigma-70 factor (ECF subfamily)